MHCHADRYIDKYAYCHIHAHCHGFGHRDQDYHGFTNDNNDPSAAALHPFAYDI
jgi:hypothetical protein